MSNLNIFAGKVQIGGESSMALACSVARDGARAAPGVEHRVMRDTLLEAVYTYTGGKMRAWVR